MRRNLLLNSPFAEVCIEQNNREEAIKYVRKITEPSIRCQYFIRLKNWSETILQKKLKILIY